MMSKISVKGSSMHPLYKFLIKRSKWKVGFLCQLNFQKFLIDEDGFVVDLFHQEQNQMINQLSIG